MSGAPLIDIYCFRISWQSFLEGKIHEYIHYKSVTDYGNLCLE